MVRIENQGGGFRELAKRILSWVVYTRRVLSTSELRHAVAVRPGKSELDEKFIPSLEIIGSICAGLVTIDVQSDVVRLVHYTTQEYFEEIDETWLPNADAHIATTCITYLSFDIFGNGACLSDAEFEDRLRLHPFYDYAASNWGHHARESSTLSLELLAFLVDDNSKLAASGQALMIKKDTGENYSQNFPSQMTALHFAAYFGIAAVVYSLIRQVQDLNLEDSDDRTPLSHAAMNGHLDAVRLLIEADLETKHARTAMSLAALNGHEAIVRLLLEKGVDFDWESDSYRPLNTAAARGHQAIVRLLLDRGASICDKGDDRLGKNTALNLAVCAERTDVVKLLLERGTSTEAKGDGNQPIWKPLGWDNRRFSEWGLLKAVCDLTVLHIAVYCGHEAIARLLLENGADINAKNEYDWTALHWAASSDSDENKEIIALLLETGINLDEKAYDGMTALQMAARNGKLMVARLLVEARADINAQDDKGSTAMHHAILSENGTEAVLRLLLEKGADLGVKDDFGRTALHTAAYLGREAAAWLLLDNNADPTAETLGGNTALHLAAFYGHTTIAQMLLDGGADIHARAADGKTVLHSAVARGLANEAVVKLLLGKGVEVDLGDNLGRTPLSCAAEGGHERIVQLLLTNGKLDCNSGDHYGATPLSLAARLGHSAVVELLLAQEGVDFDCTDKLGRNALAWAAMKDQTNVVQLLVNKYKERGMSEPSLDTTIRSEPYFDSGRGCDVCLFGISGGQTYYNCTICNSGNFDICKGCFACGMRCLINSHDLDELEAVIGTPRSSIGSDSEDGGGMLWW
ncbi:Ankyrin-3 [Dactylellina cionopaga]|nr:Ankyrin-3 [Dactylellina cionopaga]